MQGCHLLLLQPHNLLWHPFLCIHAGYAAADTSGKVVQCYHNLISAALTVCNHKALSELYQARSMPAE